LLPVSQPERWARRPQVLVVRRPEHWVRQQQVLVLRLRAVQPLLSRPEPSSLVLAGQVWESAVPEQLFPAPADWRRLASVAVLAALSLAACILLLPEPRRLERTAKLCVSSLFSLAEWLGICPILTALLKMSRKGDPGRSRGLVLHLFGLTGGEIPTVMAIDDEAAGQSRKKKSGECKKHE
jgi:hypothetical protein